MKPSLKTLLIESYILRNRTFKSHNYYCTLLVKIISQLRVKLK